MRATHLRSVAINSADPAGLAEFYDRVWGLHRVAERDGAIYMGGTGPEHHILEIHAGQHSSVRGYSLGLADRESVDAAAMELVGDQRTVVVRGPGVLDKPGGGYGLVLTDPDGREIEISADVAEAEQATKQAPVLPTKISHVVLNSPNPDEYAMLLINVLGFRLSDETDFMQFLKCGRDHHSIAVARAPHPSLNHIAFEVPTLEDVLVGVDHMRANGHDTVWGPGRHGPGKNVFGYFVAPNGQVIEYTSEIEQLKDSELAPRRWVPDDYELSDDWADINSLRPTPEARDLMLGRPEQSLHSSTSKGSFEGSS